MHCLMLRDFPDRRRFLGFCASDENVGPVGPVREAL